MKRIPDIKMLEFDKHFIFGSAGKLDNKKSMRIAVEILHEVIANELTARQKELIQMKYFDGLTFTQIADRLGLSVSTVSRTISRAEKRIYRFMRYYKKFFYAISDDED